MNPTRPYAPAAARRRLLLATAIAGLLGAWALQAWYADPAPRVQVLSVAPERIPTGDVVWLRLRADLPWQARPARLRAAYHDPAAAIGASDAIRDAEGRPAALPAADAFQLGEPVYRRGLPGLRRWRWEVAVPLQGLAPGSYRVPDLDLYFDRGRGGADTPAYTLTLPPGDATLTVLARLEPDAAGEPTPRGADIRPPLQPGWSLWTVGAGVAAGLLLLAVLLLVIRELRRPPAPLPLWERVGAALRELEAALPMAADPFYTRFTDILRDYLERRYALPATEQATPEFLVTLRRDGGPLDAETRSAIARILEQADAVKFGRAEADEPAMRAAIATARDLLQRRHPDEDDAEDDLV